LTYGTTQYFISAFLEDKLHIKKQVQKIAALETFNEKSQNKNKYEHFYAYDKMFDKTAAF
jgi:hypothetical protein